MYSKPCGDSSDSVRQKGTQSIKSCIAQDQGCLSILPKTNSSIGRPAGCGLKSCNDSTVFLGEEWAGRIQFQKHNRSLCFVGKCPLT